MTAEQITASATAALSTPTDTAAPAAATPAAIAIIAMLAIMVVAGIALAWFWQISPRARAQRNLVRIEPVAAHWLYFVVMAVFVAICGMLVQGIFGVLCKWLWPGLQLQLTFGSALAMGVFGIGVIAGALYARRFLRAMQRIQNMALAKLPNGAGAQPVLPLACNKVIPVAIGVACIVRMGAGVAGIIWNQLLTTCGVPLGEQDLALLLRSENSNPQVILILVVAVVIAPAWEEIIFRGALFGYLRTRILRPLAYVVPALVFASLHLKFGPFDASSLRLVAPLVALGVIHAMAYERTGRIAVPIISHALFNLTSVIAILCGVGA